MYERLQHLELTDAHLGPGGMRAMMLQPSWLSLRCLVLRQPQQLPPRALGALAKADLPRLEQLDLRECRIMTGGARCLATAKWLPQLHRMDLR